MAPGSAPWPGPVPSEPLVPPQKMRGWTPGTGGGGGGGGRGLRLSPPAAVPPSSPRNSGIVGRWLCLSKPQCFICKRERKF